MTPTATAASVDATYMLDAVDALLQVGDFVKIRSWAGGSMMSQVVGLQRTAKPHEQPVSGRGSTNAVLIGRDHFVMTLGNALGSTSWAYSDQLIDHYRMIDVNR